MSITHRPAYRLRIGGAELTPAAGSALAGLQLSLGKRSGAGEARITLGGSHGVQVALGDDVEVELGWADETELVFTGRVAAIEPRFGFGAPRLVVTAFCPLMQLMKAPQRPRLFENQTPGDIVKAHAGDAGVALGKVEAGPRLARALQHRESAHAHCRALAQRCGFDFYAAADGKLQFARFARSAADEVLYHGIDLLDVRRTSVAPPAGITVVPESPASSAGDETAAWLVKDPSAHAGTAGDADTLTLSDPLLRTREGAQHAAKAWLGERWRAGSATAVVPGRPSLRLGQAVELRGVSEDGLSGLYEVLALQHRFDVARGFGTTLSLARMG